MIKMNDFDPDNPTYGTAYWGLDPNRRPKYRDLKGYSIVMGMIEYPFTVMVSDKGEIGWIAHQDSQHINKQVRGDGTPVTVKNSIKSDVERMLEDIASTQTKIQLPLDQIVNKQIGLVGIIMKDIKSYKP